MTPYPVAGSVFGTNTANRSWDASMATCIAEDDADILLLAASAPTGLSTRGSI